MTLVCFIWEILLLFLLMSMFSVSLKWEISLSILTYEKDFFFFLMGNFAPLERFCISFC